MNGTPFIEFACPFIEFACPFIRIAFAFLCDMQAFIMNGATFIEFACPFIEFVRPFIKFAFPFAEITNSASKRHYKFSQITRTNKRDIAAPVIPEAAIGVRDCNDCSSVSLQN
jgi:hypothetical protein